MGQLLRRMQDVEEDENGNRAVLPSRGKFPDLLDLPPELSISVLSHLNATDLCLAGCVWESLAKDEILWMGLCKSQWNHSPAYGTPPSGGFSYHKLYLQLDEGTLTFNADPELGYQYLLNKGLIDSEPREIARFLHGTERIDSKMKMEFLERRPEVLEYLVELQNFENQFLPNALRKFFKITNPPNARSSYLSDLVDKFSVRFCSCNPNLGLSKDAVYVLCFSLIMLSVDLCSPAVKNKMSKREFIKNTSRAAQGINEDFAGHLYDNIYLVGHVAPHA